MSSQYQPEQPHDAAGDGVEDVDPHLERVGVDLVELVEVAVDDGVLGEPVLLARGHHDLLGHLLARGRLGGHQVRRQAVLDGQAVHGGLHLDHTQFII